MSIGSTALIILLAVAALAAVVMAVRISGRPSATQPMLSDAGAGAPARWYQVAAAVIVLLVLAGAIVTLISSQFAGEAARETGGWRDESRSIIFVVVMIAAAGVALVSFIALFVARLSRSPAVTVAQAHTPETVEPTQATPAGVRLIGLLGLGLAFLLLAWIYLSPTEQHALMLYLLYPACFAVALVLLFDKASRGWNPKTTAESVREWLLCDGITFLLLLGFLNLYRYEATDKYASLFWDVLHIAGFFVTFWLLDRKRTRYRFLFAYGYLVALPILLLIWRVVQEVPVPEELSWWSTVWPFFWLAIAFFVFEIIALTATRGSNHQAVPAAKDALFVLLYAVFLLVAIPDAA